MKEGALEWGDRRSNMEGKTDSTIKAWWVWVKKKQKRANRGQPAQFSAEGMRKKGSVLIPFLISPCQTRPPLSQCLAFPSKKWSSAWRFQPKGESSGAAAAGRETTNTEGRKALKRLPALMAVSQRDTVGHSTPEKGRHGTLRHLNWTKMIRMGDLLLSFFSLSC